MRDVPCNPNVQFWLARRGASLGARDTLTARVTAFYATSAPTPFAAATLLAYRTALTQEQPSGRFPVCCYFTESGMNSPSSIVLFLTR